MTLAESPGPLVDDQLDSARPQFYNLASLFEKMDQMQSTIDAMAQRQELITDDVSYLVKKMDWITDNAFAAFEGLKNHPMFKMLGVGKS